MQEGEEEHILTPVIMKKWMLSDPHGYCHFSDQPLGACHSRDQSLEAPHSLLHARDGSFATPSFVFPLLILVKCNNMIYIYACIHLDNDVYNMIISLYEYENDIYKPKCYMYI